MKGPGRPRHSSKQIRELAEIFKDGEWHYGYGLVKSTGIAPGTLYPILRRLAKDNILECRWETVAVEGRPPRKLYRRNYEAAA